MILDVDATEIEAEKQDAAWTYNHVQGYMPLVGYVNGVCVGHQFREGNQSPGAGILEFAQSCEAALPAGKRIYFRSDSAAYQAKVINYYSQPGRSFSITADLDVAVKREIQNLPEVAWQALPDARGHRHRPRDRRDGAHHERDQASLPVDRIALAEPAAEFVRGRPVLLSRGGHESGGAGSARWSGNTTSEARVRTGIRN